MSTPPPPCIVEGPARPGFCICACRALDRGVPARAKDGSRVPRIFNRTSLTSEFSGDDKGTLSPLIYGSGSRVQPSLLPRWQPSLQLESPFPWLVLSMCSSSESNAPARKSGVELNMHPSRQFPAHFVVHMPSCLHD